MPNNNTPESETIRQQRKAREEYLELKRMQNGEISAPPPPSADAVLPKTAGEKIKNFWFYYRTAVIGILLAAVVLAICISQCVSRVNYDLGVAVYVSSPVGDSDAKLIAKYFESKCEDVNGDGEIHVQVYNCSYSSDVNSQTAMANNTKIQTILVGEHHALLFITDDTTFERLESAESLNNLFDDTVLLGDNFYGSCDAEDFFPLPQNLKLSLRNISRSAMKNDKTAKATYKAAEKIMSVVGDSK